MKKQAIFIFLVAIVLSVSCQKKYGIQSRAEKQIPLTVEHLLMEEYEQTRLLGIKNLEPIYANDSICIYQFTMACKDANDYTWSEDMRYTYLIDLMVSRVYGKPVFNENLRRVPCMPKKLIRAGRRDVKRKHEAVYDKEIGRTERVRFPYQD